MNAQNDERLFELSKGRWKDEHLLTLAINDHIYEAGILRNSYVEHKTAEKLVGFENKLMDLFILLSMWAKEDPNLFNQRLDIFLATKEISVAKDNLFDANKEKTKTKTKR